MSYRLISFKADQGQTMAEYTVVLGVITFGIVTTISLLSGAIGAAYERTLEVVQAAF
jgi:Flp pilus assembly pilin Flp